MRGAEPPIDEDVTGREFGRGLFTQLRTLSKENAEGVAQHLVMAGRLLDVDIDRADAHARTAVRRAGRVAAAREMMGLVHYRKGEWSKALAEFRTVRRLSGSEHLLPLMVDCERAQGRYDKALALAVSTGSRDLDVEGKVELAIVVSGIRRDLEQYPAAVAALEIPQLRSRVVGHWRARLCYAYADALLSNGDAPAARDWFARASDADPDGDTDAADRLDELDGIVHTDLEDEPAD